MLLVQRSNWPSPCKNYSCLNWWSNKLTNWIFLLVQRFVGSQCPPCPNFGSSSIWNWNLLLRSTLLCLLMHIIAHIQDKQSWEQKLKIAPRPKSTLNIKPHVLASFSASSPLASLCNACTKNCSGSDRDLSIC